MIRLLSVCLLALSLASCRDVDPDEVGGRWTLTGNVVPSAEVSCTLSGTLDIMGTTEGFTGTATWTHRVVRAGVVEAQTATHEVEGGRSTVADEPVGPPVPGHIAFIDAGRVVRAHFIAIELTSLLMWGPWECEGLEGNWFLRPSTGSGG